MSSVASYVSWCSPYICYIFILMACLLKSAESTFCAFSAVLVHPLMRLRLDVEQLILLIRAESRAKRSNSDQFRPNFRAESPAPGRINILWLRTQSNKPFILYSKSTNRKTFRMPNLRGFESRFLDKEACVAHVLQLHLPWEPVRVFVTSPIYADSSMLCSTTYRYDVHIFLNAVS